MTAKAALKAATESEEIAQATLKSAKHAKKVGPFPRVTGCVRRRPLPMRHWNIIVPTAITRKRWPCWYRFWELPGNTVILLPEDLTANAGEMRQGLERLAGGCPEETIPRLLRPRRRSKQPKSGYCCPFGRFADVEFFQFLLPEHADRAKPSQ